MVLYGLKSCIDCKRYKMLHPEYTYIELDSNVLTLEEKSKLKKILEKHKWDKKVPILVDEKTNLLISRTKLIQELRVRTSKTRPCKNCGM